MTPTYTTLTIRIDRHASGYAVALDLDGDQQFDAGVRTDLPPRWTADLTAAGYGERLFAWLADHAEFQRGWAGASACRVRLCLGRDVPDLHAYPWECLRDGVTQDFIAATAATPFSRYPKSSCGLRGNSGDHRDRISTPMGTDLYFSIRMIDCRQ